MLSIRLRSWHLVAGIAEPIQLVWQLPVIVPGRSKKLCLIESSAKM